MTGPYSTKNVSPALRPTLFSVREARNKTMAGTFIARPVVDPEYQLRRHLDVFAFDLLAYVLRDGICYLVLKPTAGCNPDKWSTREVAERWLQLFHAPPPIRSYLRGESLTASEMRAVEWVTAGWRHKLADKSFLIRSLNREFPVRLLPALCE